MNVTKNSSGLLRASAVLLVLVPALVKAQTTTNYGNVVGTDVVYSNVTETATSPTTAVPLYGAPSAVGNELLFTHMTFSAIQSNGASATTAGMVNTEIISKGGFGQFVGQLQLQEVGQVTLAGTGTSATSAIISNEVVATVLAIDFTPLAQPVTFTAWMTTSNGGEWNLPPPINAKSWSGSLTLNIASDLANAGYSSDATMVDLEVYNELDTTSEPGTTASIAKKAAGVQVMTTMIPEPGSFALLVLGGTLLLIGRLRRKS
ncbi:MAG TPA: PEP-CTERM sorting domain-containing protein [Verrucomicrobiae bacterium]|nr:PEP-CTERM sorting domain-containing protein [Verrucomicrobiae bacterium]